jgi:sec-independent protein translocase protein TatA
MNLGSTELIIILVIVLLLFGSKKLPGLAKGIGDSIRELRSAANDEPDKGKSRDA